MKKIYQTPLIEDLNVLGDNLICVSLGKDGNAGAEGIIEADSREYIRNNVWDDDPEEGEAIW